jgi:hypothetical protein
VSRPPGTPAGNGDAAGGSMAYVPSGLAVNGTASMTAPALSGP